MGFGDYLALTGLAASAIVFFLLARSAASNRLTVSSYLLADRTATKKDYGPSMVAASTSLATVILFFLGTVSYYGWTLLLCGITYYAGQILFIKLVGRTRISTNSLSTNAQFWHDYTGARFTSFVIALLTVMAFLIILFVELYIGSVILTYYFAGDDGVSGWAGLLAFVLLGSVVIAYVRVGGMRVVFQTDAWQLRLMLASVIALAIFVFTLPPTTSDTEPPAFGSFSASAGTLIVFYAWIILLNFTLPFTQLSSWQRLASTSSVREAMSGLIRSSPSFLIIWFLPVLCFAGLLAKGYEFGDLTQLFDTLRTGPETSEGILYPIIFIGFASALFSTADTAMIALQFAVSDKLLSGKTFQSTDEQVLRKRFLVSMIVIVILLGAVFFVAQADLGSWFMPLVYAIFGQLTITAPQMLYAIVGHIRGASSRSLSVLGDSLNAVAMCLAWLILMGSTLLKAQGYLPQEMSQEIATFIAVAVSTLGVLAAHITKGTENLSALEAGQQS
ncbi:hypothetical protein [Algisphaera agarilytica]|uniref:Na+/proline symporter n=1 Tax=Algisphaera agarilytica TaxID=1385975 RepID=A0A7X0H3U1_9BACT|nr:hypothetical protein [Algisphaera agarilytica]MBB6428735.1 Na+/proline symporter [Algisphaera agarilytica]